MGRGDAKYRWSVLGIWKHEEEEETKKKRKKNEKIQTEIYIRAVPFPSEQALATSENEQWNGNTAT